MIRLLKLRLPCWSKYYMKIYVIWGPTNSLVSIHLRHPLHRIVCHYPWQACTVWLAHFSLNNVHKRGLKHHHFISCTVSKIDLCLYILVYSAFFLAVLTHSLSPPHRTCVPDTPALTCWRSSTNLCLLSGTLVRGAHPDLLCRIHWY